MSATHPPNVILKILSGVQAGVDVALADGEYILGAGDDADIQILDVSLSPRHAKLLVSNGNVSILALSGTLQTRSGLTVEPGDDIRQLQPLDVVTAAATRFVIAPPDADWGSAINASEPRLPTIPRGRKRLLQLRSRRAGMMVVTGMVLLLCFWAVALAIWTADTSGSKFIAGDLREIETAIGKLDFADRLIIETLADGTINIEGFLEKQADRRKLLAALQPVGPAVKTHILVLEVVRDEISRLLHEQAPGVTFDISPAGEILLQGVVLEDQGAEKLIRLVSDVTGNTLTIRSEIRTGFDILVEAGDLSTRSQIAPFIELSVAGALIEARGAIPLGKLDGWAGFLQAYASRFGRLMPLRSRVGLQDANGAFDSSRSDRALYLDPGNRLDEADKIDTLRLKNGAYTAADLLIVDVDADSSMAAQEPKSFLPVRGNHSHVNLASLLTTGDRFNPGGDINIQAARAIKLWESRELEETKEGVVLAKAISLMNSNTTPHTTSIEGYKKLLSPTSKVAAKRCWRNSHISIQNVAGVLFWLDVLYGSTELTLAGFGDGTALLLAEAALNPMRTAACAQLASDGGLNSLYLEKASKEPGTAGVLLRDLPKAGVEITGLSLPGTRYIQLNDGRKFRENQMVDADVSVVSIGELGVIFARSRGISLSIVAGTLTWQTN